MGLVPPWLIGRVLLALTLVAAIALSQLARAPAQPVTRSELRRLLAAALSLYAVGVLAALTHHPVLAGIVYAGGITTCALAAWLSRAPGSEEPPRGGGPDDDVPPPEHPEFDWERFEAEFRRLADRPRVGA